MTKKSFAFLGVALSFGSYGAYAEQTITMKLSSLCDHDSSYFTAVVLGNSMQESPIEPDGTIYFKLNESKEIAACRQKYESCRQKSHSDSCDAELHVCEVVSQTDRTIDRLNPEPEVIVVFRKDDGQQIVISPSELSLNEGGTIPISCSLIPKK
jgi:hypothetical protein